jgi:hypothetical protein
LSEEVEISTEWVSQIPVVHFRGVLDARSYLPIRNALVKNATDSPAGVVAVVDHLAATTESAWTVLTSASWLLRQWPGIPLSAVAASDVRRRELARNAVTRYVPVHASIAAAIDAVRAGHRDHPTRLRARYRRPRSGSALIQMRDLVTETLADWGRPECIPAARCVASVLVGNVLQHTESDLDLRIELRGDHLTLAMHDGNPAPAVLRESAATANVYVSGLAIMAALSHSWGTAPSDDGKTVWAVLGPEQFRTLTTD